MARKKKEDEISIEEYVLTTFSEFFKNLDPKDVALCLIFIYAMWTGYGKTTLPTKTDVIVGILLGLTIPDALRGGIVANTYAVTTLGTLGLSQFTDAAGMNKWKKVFQLTLETMLPGNLNPLDIMKAFD